VEIETRCPEAAILQQFMLGLISPAEAEFLGKHLLQCADCGEVVQTLKADDPLIACARAGARAGNPERDTIEALVERLLQSSSLTPPPWDMESRLESKRLFRERATNTYDFLAPAQGPEELGRLGSYRVLRALGSGGMGIVFLAEDVHLKRLVALKVMRPALARNSAARQRFLREAQATAAIENEHIVTIHQVGEDGGIPFLAMQLLQGETLEARLRRDKRLPVTQVLGLGREIAEGLAAAHQHGLMHRDIKPANIFLAMKEAVIGSTGADGTRGEGKAPRSSSVGPRPSARVPHVKIVDFGLVWQESAAEPLTHSGRFTGTPGYMAPEQIAGQPEPRSDLFSLGCVLYQMCTGALPVSGPASPAWSPTARPPAMIPKPAALLNAGVPRPLVDLILKLLAQESRDRPRSARDVVAALACCERAQESYRSRRLRLFSVLAAAAALIAGTLIYLNTGAGTLVLEVNTPDVKVNIDGKQVSIHSPRDEISVTVGRHDLKISRDGFTTYAKTFAIRRNGIVELSARLEPLAQPPQTGKELAKELAALAGRLPAAVGKNAADKTVVALRQDYLAYRNRSAGAPEAVRATELMSRLAWPADALAAEQIPVEERNAASLGNSKKLSAILGDSRLRHWAAATSVAFSKDGLLASGSADHTVILWNPATGRPRQVFRGHSGAVRGVAFSPDGQLLASAHWNGSVKLWSLATGREVRTFAGHNDIALAVAFSPDGGTIASGSANGSAKLWDVATGNERGTLVHHKGREWVHAVAFSPDGKTLATGCGDRTIKLWHWATKEVHFTLSGHQEGVHCVAFSRDSQMLASGAFDGTIKFWQVATGKERPAARAIRNTGAVSSVAFTRDGKTLFSGSTGGTIKTWDVAGGQERTLLDGELGEVHSMAITPDCQALAAGAADGSIALWDLAKDPSAQSWKNGRTQTPLAVAFSPDGRLLASAGGDRRVHVWDLGTQQSRTLAGHGETVKSLAFAADGRLLASGGWDGEIRLWDPATGTLQHSIKAHPREVNSLSFSGRSLASASGDGTIKLWNAASGEQQGPALRGHSSWVGAASYSPDGQTLASASGDGTVKLWNVATRQERRTEMAMKHATGPPSVTFSPDGRLLASAGGGDMMVKVWDAATGKEQATLSGHTSQVWSVAFSPDGNILASAAHDGTVRLWNPRTGKQTQVLALGPSGGFIHGIAFSPESRHLASANGNGTVYIVRLGPVGIVLSGSWSSASAQQPNPPAGFRLSIKTPIGPSCVCNVIVRHAFHQRKVGWHTFSP
jgi:WD40 repeat protein/serine/threonine protein kinase